MKIEEVINSAIEDKIATGISFAVVSKNGVLFEYVSGKTGESGNQIDRMTLFDLASLTKVIFTTPLILKLVEEGLLSLKDPISLYFEGLPNDVTIQTLLTHTSGLKSWLPLFSEDLTLSNEEPHEVGRISKSVAIEKIRQFGFERSPNVAVEYSDLGFILLGFLIENILKNDLKVIAKEFFTNLGMNDTNFEPTLDVAETESVSGVHLKGVVHDENARALGGASGHAGLFSNLKDLELYSLYILNSGSYNGKAMLSRFSIELMRTPFTKTLEPVRSIGFVMGKSLNIAPDFAPDESIGHSGFTGTSIYFDFRNNISIILLTNRVYYGRKNTLHMHLRRVLGNLAYMEIL